MQCCLFELSSMFMMLNEEVRYHGWADEELSVTTGCSFSAGDNYLAPKTIIQDLILKMFVHPGLRLENCQENLVEFLYTKVHLARRRTQFVWRLKFKCQSQCDLTLTLFLWTQWLRNSLRESDRQACSLSSSGKKESPRSGSQVYNCYFVRFSFVGQTLLFCPRLKVHWVWSFTVDNSLMN